MASPGGQPSTTQPIAGPWLSPKVVTLRSLPNVLLDMESRASRFVIRNGDLLVVPGARRDPVPASSHPRHWFAALIGETVYLRALAALWIAAACSTRSRRSSRN